MQLFWPVAAVDFNPLSYSFLSKKAKIGYFSFRRLNEIRSSHTSNQPRVNTLIWPA